jgi:hypothetical protein
MAKDILIRNVPDSIHNWIEDERYQKRMSKQDFIFQVLEKASNYGQQSLFDNVQNIAKPYRRPFPLHLSICFPALVVSGSDCKESEDVAFFLVSWM